MTRKIFTACLGTETNSFSPIPTGLDLFERTMLVRNGNFGDRPNLFSLPLIHWRERAQKLGWQVEQGLAAFATPAGDTTRSAYESLRDEILSELQAAMPVDAVLLNLHGAMVADGYPGHMTQKKLDAADVLIYFKEYPHIDAVDRAEELFSIAYRMVEDGLQPSMAMHDCKMLGIYPTTAEPLMGFVQRMKALEEQPDVLSVSLIHGFPWSNMPDIGTRVLVVTDNKPELANSTARELGDWVWSNRDCIVAPFIDMDQAFDRVVQSAPAGQPFVLADMADNTGLGAAGDSTFVLKRLLKRDLSGFAIAPLWDPVAVDIAHDAGIGATLKMRIGGKLGLASGDPLDALVTVKGLARDAHQRFGGGKATLGDVAWLRIGDNDDNAVDIIVNACRVQAFDPQCFSAAGLDPHKPKALIVKSTQHFHAGFAPIAREIIYMATPGCGPMDFAGIEHPLVNAPLWPRIDNPHSSD